MIALQTGRYQQAAELIGRALALDARAAQLHNNMGYALWRLGRLAEARASYDRALALDPRNAEAHNNLGNLMIDLGRIEDARASFERAIAVRPDYANAHCNLANALNALKLHGAALESAERALRLQPGHGGALCNKGMALHALHRFDQAQEAFERAVALDGAPAAAHGGYGNLLLDLGQSDKALASYQRALRIDPRNADSHYNLARAFLALKRTAEALESYDRALAINPGHVDALCGRGNILQETKRFDLALASYDAAIAARPDHAPAHGNRANALVNMGRLDEALTSYERALALSPRSAQTHRNHAVALVELGRLEDALASYERAFELDADLDYLRGDRLFLKMRLCDWSGYREEIAHVEASAVRGERASQPFALLTLADSAEAQLVAARTWTHERFTAAPLVPAVVRRHDKIRIGYFSSDLIDHPVADLTAGLFQRHDRSIFEVSCFSHSRKGVPETLHRVAQKFDHFVDIRQMSDEEVAVLARKQEIDIAVDLNGYTSGSRPGIFARRAAPIQATYLYVGTTGSQFFDYVFADPIVVPDDDRHFYSEKVVHLPTSFLVQDSRRAIAEDWALSRDELGLPEEAFVFCCFNNSYKITPDVFACWMRILNRVEGSVLWLLEDNAAARANLRRAAEANDIDAGRLVFAPRVSVARHLARQRAADLFLDTLPYNAHATASDALWVGLPVLTHIGRTFAGRVAASLLDAVGLPELVAENEARYEASAVELATQPQRFAAIKAKLAANRSTMPLFDTERFVRGFDRALLEIWRRHEAGLPPEHLEIGL